MLNAVIRPITLVRLPSLHNDRICLSEEVANGSTGVPNEAIHERVSVLVEASAYAVAANGYHASTTHASTTEQVMRLTNLECD